MKLFLFAFLSMSPMIAQAEEAFTASVTKVRVCDNSMVGYQDRHNMLAALFDEKASAKCAKKGFNNYSVISLEEEVNATCRIGVVKCEN